MRNSSKSPSGTSSFPDKRLEKRFHHILDALTRLPEGSIPEACGSWADTKATYRFLDSDSFETTAIDEEMYRDTLTRIAALSTVLVLQDTTVFTFTQHPQTKGLGYLSDVSSRGMFLHSAFAVNPLGLPLGVLDRRLWTRDDENFGKTKHRKKKQITEKESYRWLETEAAVAARLGEDIHMVMISDRESDIYEYIARARPPKCEMLIRVARNRRLAEQGEHKLMFDRLEASPIQGRSRLAVTNHKTGKKRDASLTYRWTTVTLSAPSNGTATGGDPVMVHMIVVREEHVPAGEVGVEWKLMTTVTLEAFSDVLRIVQWYSYRWLIERFHYVLKSGCAVEELQLEECARLERAIALYMIVAWRLLYMTYKARIEPEQSATEILEPHEWKALYCTAHKTRVIPPQAPTVEEAVLMIAKLGGFLARRHDGPPGVKVLWRGMRKLEIIAETYLFFVEDEQKIVGNG